MGMHPRLPGGTMTRFFNSACSVALAAATTAFAGTSALAEGLTFHGELSLTARHFTQNGAFAGQATSGTSLIPETRVGLSAALGFADFELELYGRGDDRTGNEVFDIQKAYISAGTDIVSVLFGSDVVFWGTAESFNPTNIINQDDRFARVEETRKLGQPMINLNVETGALGTLSFYGLLGFREVDFGDGSTRPRFSTVPDDSRTIFQSSHRDVDFAFRNTNTLNFANGSLDYALSYFQGTSRAPVILPGCANLAAPTTAATCNAVNADIRASYEGLTPAGTAGATLPALVAAASTPATQAFLLGGSSVGSVPYYQNIQQVGMEMAYAAGDWIWKFEGTRRFTSNEDYFSGVFGFEYRFVNPMGSTGDLTISTEYTFDDRSVLQPATVFDDDIFASVRYDFNNRLSTSVALSGLYDLDTKGKVFNFDVTSRITDSTRIGFSATHIDSNDPNDPLTALNSDDYYELKFSYFF